MIKNVKFSPARLTPKTPNNLIGFIELVYEDMFIRSIALKVNQESGKLFLLFPSEKHRDTTLQVCYPITRDVYDCIMFSIVSNDAIYQTIQEILTERGLKS
jgi:hypothetical protein